MLVTMLIRYIVGCTHRINARCCKAAGSDADSPELKSENVEDASL